MTEAFDNELKDRIRTTINIVDLIGSYVELRRQGRGFVARCPFHDDRHPSMQVNADRQSWKCWVCDVGGDIFSFVMQKEGVTFPEALRLLADRAGIVIESPKSKGGRSNSSEKKALYDAANWVVTQYHELFLNDPSAAIARDYIRDRGLTDESIHAFKIGFAPNHWTWLTELAPSKGISLDTLEAIGMLTKNERGTRYDRFRNRVLFPIRDPQGRSIAIGGRILPGETTEAAKYINCSETRLYHKSHQLFGLDLARESIQKTRQAVVTEGYTDVVMAFQHGIRNAVACCGTALGDSHIQLLKRYCDSVVLLLDGDEAGQRRTSEILELFVGAQLDLRILTLPNDLDPCDFLIQNDGETLTKLIAGAVDALEHKIRSVCQGFDPLLDTNRANVALERILQTMSRVSHHSLLTDAARLRQDQVLARLGKQFGIDQNQIRKRLESIRSQNSQRESTRRNYDTSEQTTAPKTIFTSELDSTAIATAGSTLDAFVEATNFRFNEMSAIERELFEILILNPELVSFAIERIPDSVMTSPTAKALFQMYQELELDGHALDFENVMLVTDEPKLKSLLVSIEDHASKKIAKSSMTSNERLQSLCERTGKMEESVVRRTQIRSLEQKTLDEHSELSLLQEIISQAQARQGIVPQT